MTPDDLTAPDRPEDLNPPEPNDSLRRDLLRVLDAADTVGLAIRSIHGGSPAWFVYGDHCNGWPVGCARSLAAALDAAIIDITPATSGRYDHLNVRLDKWTTLHLPIETQVTDADLRAAALTLGRLAGQDTAPAWVDPTAVRDAYRAARHRVVAPEDLIALGAAAQTLGIHDDTH